MIWRFLNREHRGKVDPKLWILICSVALSAFSNWANELKEVWKWLKDVCDTWMRRMKSAYNRRVHCCFHPHSVFKPDTFGFGVCHHDLFGDTQMWSVWQSVLLLGRLLSFSVQQACNNAQLFLSTHFHWHSVENTSWSWSTLISHNIKTTCLKM